MHLTYRQTCRVCGNPHLTDVIDLGDQYLQGSFVKPGMPEPSRRKIPTKLVRCDPAKREGACGAVQMSVSVPPRILYSNYFYTSGTTATMRNHLAEIVSRIMEIIRQDRPYHVLRVADLACNDGSLLSHYPQEMARYGVDPSDIARKATDLAKGATIINDLFPTAALPGNLDAISTIAMLYDIEDPVTFVREVKKRLKPDGIWVAEVAYLPATLKQVSLDTVVHEHLLYYSLATLEYVVAQAGMRVFRAETNSINGGSIQIYCSHADYTAHDRRDWTEALSALRIAEFDLELDTQRPYTRFFSDCQKVRWELNTLIDDIRSRGQTIALLGASTKANTMVQFLGLDRYSIPYAIERSPAKWGAKTLGTDIPIISEEEGRARKPDYLLIGPWHFRNEIIQREAETIRAGTKLIFPLPQVEVITSLPEEKAA